jgi:hypothetical protein
MTRSALAALTLPLAAFLVTAANAQQAFEKLFVESK